MIHKLILSTVAAIPATLFAGSFGPLLRSEDDTFPEDCCAIHLIHITGGDFLMWGNSNGGVSTDTWTWNAFTGKFSDSPMTIEEDVFCCGVSQLPDGRPIIAGGNMNLGFGIDKTFLFNLSTRQWSTEPILLNEDRWYPTLAELSDGTMTAISGWAAPDDPGTEPDDPTWNKRVDVFNPAAETWSDFMPTFDSTIHPDGMQPFFYPFMFAYYDNSAPTTRKLFFAGRNTAHGPGEAYGFKTFSLAFEPGGGAGVWSLLGGNSDMEGSGAVIMIGGTDPIDAGTVYKFAGRRNGVIVDRGRKINLNDPPSIAVWVATADMPTGQNRTECNVVAMADGSIAVVGGTYSTVIQSLASTGRNNILIYNPATDSYDEISPDFAGTRMYHSTSVFAPTATIFIAGGQYKENAPPNTLRSNFTAQEYYPSYFEVDSIRPIITASPTTAYWNTTIQVTATGPVDHFSLVKLSSTTHANDTTQRYIKVTEASRTGNNYQLKMPKNGGIAPPGNYMLFAVSTSGVPSVARYIHIGPSS
ncbi:MAG: galactose oxidase early set domain-containing protein [Armatimonadota bacterium]|nr:galactose oxidase early set domain-containing protein [Armatimonadota bacterium]